MGRAEQRRKQRQQRLEDRKGKLLVSPKDITDIKAKIVQDSANYDVEMLMTCFALAERRLYKFGRKRLMRSLRYIDQLMVDIIEDKATIEDYKKALDDEVHIAIKY